jgi:hypothetical protein
MEKYIEVTYVDKSDERYGKSELWPMSQILEEINRDRSDEWTDYNETDWKEGWAEFVQGEFYTLT